MLASKNIPHPFSLKVQRLAIESPVNGKKPDKRHHIKLYQFIRLSLILLITACSPRNTQGENWVIFTETQARATGVAEWFAKPNEPTDYWTPAEKQILIIESKTPSFLRETSNAFVFSEPPPWERLDEYKRQYIGIIIAERKIIYANFFCNSFETDWRKEFVFVLDGGNCFFQFMYDLNTGEFFNLQINGEA